MLFEIEWEDKINDTLGGCIIVAENKKSAIEIIKSQKRNVISCSKIKTKKQQNKIISSWLN